MLCHDLFKRPFHRHQLCRRWHGPKREVSGHPESELSAGWIRSHRPGRSITGSSRGIGRTLAAGLADAGATVVLNGMHQAALQDAQASFREQYGTDRVFGRAFDVTDELQGQRR